MPKMQYMPKMQNMPKMQYGGLKLQKVGDNSDNIGFTPVYNMIQKGKLELLTASSLKGFMFTLNVPKDNDSRYFELNRAKFTKKVKSFILKFVIIASKNDTSLGKYGEKSKASESNESFFEEAKTQQNIWVKSITGATKEICPSIANFSLFHNSTSVEFIKYLLNSNNVDLNAMHPLNFIYNKLLVNKDYELGIITMKNYEKSRTLHSFLSESGISDNDKKYVFSCIITKIIRLFLLGYIHFDLHSNNILVVYDDKGNNIVDYDCVIIDYGRVSNLNDKKNDKYLSSGQKQHLTSLRDNLFDFILDIKSSTSSSNFEYIMNIILTFDENNNKKYGNNYPQMKWYNNDIIKSIIQSSELFYKIKNEVTVDINGKIMEETIRRFVKNDEFFNYESNNVRDFYVEEKNEYKITDMEMDTENTLVLGDNSMTMKDDDANMMNDDDVNRMKDNDVKHMIPSPQWQWNSSSSSALHNFLKSDKPISQPIHNSKWGIGGIRLNKTKKNKRIKSALKTKTKTNHKKRTNSKKYMSHKKRIYRKNI